MHDFDLLREIDLFKYLLEQINAIEVYVDGFDEDMFLSNNLTKDASLMKLIVLGEYSARVDEGLKSRFNEVQWQLIKAARNYYAHLYNGINWKRVWEVIVADLPGLKIKIEHIIEVLEKENNAEIN
jgi:uncharacterized protein with HEPN domain